MKQMHVVEFTNLSRREVRELPYPIKITFDDGTTVEAKPLRSLLTWTYLRPHRHHPGTPIHPSHCMWFEKATGGHEQKIVGRIISDIMFYMVDSDPATYHNVDAQRDLVSLLSQQACFAINEAHNMAVSDWDHYGSTLDFETLHELTSDPTLVEMKERAHASNNEEKIQILTDEITPYIKNKVTTLTPETARNGIALQARSGVGSMRSILQLIGSRGNVQSINSDVYKQPIISSYADGLYDIGDTLTESPQSSRSLRMNEDPLRKAETLNRVMQIFIQVTVRVVGYDCGSTDCYPLMVTEKDLPWIKGKFRLDENDKPVEIRTIDRSLIGKLVRIRTITRCLNDDPSTVCLTCMGHSARITPGESNAAHYIGAKPLGDTSQLIMAIKHFETTSGFVLYHIRKGDESWLRINDRDGVNIDLIRKSRTGKWRLRFSEEEAVNLRVLFELKEKEMVALDHVTKLTFLEIGEVGKHGELVSAYHGIEVNSAKRTASLSRAVLEQIRKNGWRTEDGMVICDVEDITGKTLFVTERRSEDMMDYYLELKHFVFGKEGLATDERFAAGRGHTLSGCVDANEGITTLRKLFDKKLQTSMVHCEVFVRAGMARNPIVGDYTLPRGDEDYMLVKAGEAIMARSPVGAMAYQGGSAMMKTPTTYLRREKPPHPLDPMMYSGFRDTIGSGEFKEGVDKL